jgi:tetratricopeptide (TPR) repeat protein
MNLGYILFWLIGAVLIGNYAVKLNRNYWVWVGWAIITSPFVAWILLEIIGNRLRVWTKDDIKSAKYLVQNKQYNDAIELLKNVIITDPTDSVSCYNIACLYSILEDKDNALFYLKTAIDKGYSNKRKILVDKDLEWLRNQVNLSSI